MMIDKKFKFIDIETTTFCNAKCPFCVRTNLPNLKLEHLSLDVIKKIPFEKFEIVNILGNKGDGIFYPELFDLIKYVKKVSSAHIGLFTNASGHKSDWWEQLAIIMGKNSNLIYTIDGLKETHSLHRIGTRFDTVIRNVTIYNSFKSGTSTCQTIVFKQNQHQLEEIKTLAKNIGTDNFWLRKSRAFSQILERPDGASTRHELNKQSHKPLNCDFLLPSIYLRSDGELRSCCFMADDDYVNNLTVHLRENIRYPQHIISYKKDSRKINLKYLDFENILLQDFFKYIEKNRNFLHRCNEKCHVTFEDIVDSNKL